MEIFADDHDENRRIAREKQQNEQKSTVNAMEMRGENRKVRRTAEVLSATVKSANTIRNMLRRRARIFIGVLVLGWLVIHIWEKNKDWGFGYKAMNT
ncbi:hypothetical protein Aduo_014852 [Ancylostoma duodenale]